MRRRIPWIAAVVLLFTAILSGCGSKDATSIVKDLDKVMTKMESYQGSGKMILHTGQQPLEYKVEVWYQKPKFYRIALTNEKRDITQIVLRNDEGVFVLTPSLNKSYRFQSDWPDNQGQVYLFQTLVQSIVLDNTRQFTTDKDAYVFDVMASNYQNGSFARQKIWLAKNNYAPRHVEVTDTNNNVMVEVKFEQFEFGKKFDNSAFDMKENMGKQPHTQSTGMGDNGTGGSGTGDNVTGGNGIDGSSDGTNGAVSGTDSGTSGQPGQDPAASPADEGAAAPVPQDSVPAVTEPDPVVLPDGVALKDQVDVSLGDKTGVMLRYSGTYDFTILEMVSKDRAVSANQGIMLDLGFTMGLLSGNETRTLTWSYEGVEYRLTTADLPEEHMVKVAQSMVESSGK